MVKSHSMINWITHHQHLRRTRWSCICGEPGRRRWLGSFGWRWTALGRHNTSILLNIVTFDFYAAISLTIYQLTLLINKWKRFNCFFSFNFLMPFHLMNISGQLALAINDVWLQLAGQLAEGKCLFLTAAASFVEIRQEALATMLQGFMLIPHAK